MERVHPWSDGASDFKTTTLPYLKLHGLTIGAKATEGDPLCKRIVGNYQMLYRSFDPVTYMALKADIEEYEAARRA